MRPLGSFSRILATAFMFFLAANVAALAGTPAVTIQKHDCGDGTALWLWVAETPGTTCSGGPGGWWCVNDLGDRVSGSCEQGCTALTARKTAGCWLGKGSPDTSKVTFSFVCENGRVFDLAARPGDECTRVGEEAVCEDPGRKGDELSVRASCGTGCERSVVPADCFEH